MIFSSIITDYFRWHYTRAFHELFHVWLNFLWFTIHFFSIPQLFTSLFAPWRRMTEERERGWNFENLASYVIINLLSRLVGATMRTGVLLLGLICLTAVIVIGASTVLLWIFIPVLSAGAVLTGLSLLISNLIIII